MGEIYCQDVAMIARYRSTEALVIGWALIGVALVIVFAVFQQGFSTSTLLIAGLIVLLAWLVAIRPAIMVYEHALIIQNVFRRHVIPWMAITEVSAPLLLTVKTDDGRRISAWAISSSGRSRMRGEASRADEIAYELEHYRTVYRR